MSCCVSDHLFFLLKSMCVSFDVSSIEKSQSEIIGSFRQVEWVFSVNRMAVFGNELIRQKSRVNRPNPWLLPAKALSGFRSPVPQLRLFHRCAPFQPLLAHIAVLKRVEYNHLPSDSWLLVKFVSRKSRLNILINFAQMLDYPSSVTLRELE